MADQPDQFDHDAAVRHDESIRADERRRIAREDEKQSKPDDGDGKGSENDGKPAKPRSRLPLIILAIVAIAAVIGGVWYYLSTRNLISTDDAYTDGHAITISPRVNGYVTTLAITDNQRVHAGDLLLQIDPRDYIAARDQAAGAVTVAEAQLTTARLNLDTARITYPARLASAQGQLEQARATLTNAQAEYKRQHSVSREATTQQNVDQSVAGQQSALGQVAVAQATVNEANLIPQQIALAEAQVKQLQGQLAQARAQLATAELNLSWTRITAPSDGWVTKRNVEQGNLVANGQSLLSLVTPDLWVTANFKETQLNRMRPGQPVDISVDAYPALKLTGHVDSVQLGSGSKFTAFPAENATGNYVKIVQRVPVKIIIDHGLKPDEPPIPLGVSVTPTVRVP